MKIYKRLFALLFVLLLICSLLPVSAFAAGSIDPSRDVSLTVSYLDGKTALEGASFSIYLVATVDESGELTTTKAFSGFNVKIRGKNDDAWRAMASTLEGYVLRDNLTPADRGTTNHQGSVSFPTAGKKLTQGLYLVIGARHTQDGYRYDLAPFMAMLPSQDLSDNVWDYDIAVSAKFTSTRIPENNVPVYVTRRALKVWNDEGFEGERPNEITVQLLRNGAVYRTVTLNAANNWRYTWTDLDSRYAWTVVETEMEGYTVTVTREGVTFVVTNTYGEAIEDEEVPLAARSPLAAITTILILANKIPLAARPNLPKTGQLWWPVPVLIALGLLLIIIGLLRRRGAFHEA